LTKRFPKLLRATRGARLAREDIAESDISVERVYFRDGALRMQVPLRDGKRHGLGCSMFKSGGVSLLLPYSLGRIEGTVKSFAEGGTLLSETPYESGQRHGAERFFNEDGRLIGTTWWFRGGLVQEENLEKHTEEAPPSRND
jgi:antitoxin component YwqK of YwqJK toxin-antitoxin module